MTGGGDRDRAIEHLLRHSAAAGSAALDPAANIRLGMRCTDCGHAWDAVLDIGACFWDELGTRARQLLESVHRLASAYGWREAETLALSPARRAAYLNLIG